MSELVTSLQNTTVKLVVSLKQKKKRDEMGLFTAEGVRLIEEAVSSDWIIETCLYTEHSLNNDRVKGIINSLEDKACKMIKVSESVFDKISDTEQPQGIMIIIKKRSYTLNHMLASDNPLIVVLDSLQDPGNLGTVIRTADAAGATSVVLTKGCTDVYASKAVRATMGSLFHLPVVSGVNQDDLISFVSDNSINLTATSLSSSSVYFEADFSKPVAIVFGNEGRGVSDRLLDASNNKVFIPIFGAAESLNVAASAAVILYEAVRQRC
ncbi:TrmH family RNA methyltransferase [Dendrosporobacter sp. 1207_IL3150]|uniref:TrmH family RNA methyltransferase n=1 Tax=Dendrosporobacter sp. 1207_IL3150 TaxID=3084054 RepID=UPI002FDB77E1